MSAPITIERLDAIMLSLRPHVTPEERRPRPGCLESAIGNALNAASYQQDTEEPDVLWITAFLMRSLAKNHCYLDGNKRIAWLAGLDVLAVHGAMTLDVDEDKAAATVEALAKGELDVPALTGWLGEHVVALS